MNSNSLKDVDIAGYSPSYNPELLHGEQQERYFNLAGIFNYYLNLDLKTYLSWQTHGFLVVSNQDQAFVKDFIKPFQQIENFKWKQDTDVEQAIRNQTLGCRKDLVKEEL